MVQQGRRGIAPTDEAPVSENEGRTPEAIAEDTANTTPTEGTDGSTPAAPAAKTKKAPVRAKDLDPKERVSMMFGVPAGLKAVVEAAAEEAKQPVAEFARQIIADKFGYKIEPSERTPAKKYANDEERDNARKTAGKVRRAKIRTLLEAYESGSVQLPPEVKAALDALNAAGPSGEGSDAEEAAKETVAAG